MVTPRYTLLAGFSLCPPLPKQFVGICFSVVRYRGKQQCWARRPADHLIGRKVSVNRRRKAGRRVEFAVDFEMGLSSEPPPSLPTPPCPRS
jgi:hypothetical protein